MLVFTSHRTGSGFKFYLRIFSLQFCNFSVSFRYFFKTFFGERVELRVVPIFRIKVVLVQAPEEVPQIPQDLDVFARPIRAVEHDRAHELGGLRNRAELTRQERRRQRSNGRTTATESGQTSWSSTNAGSDSTGTTRVSTTSPSGQGYGPSWTTS